MIETVGAIFSVITSGAGGGILGGVFGFAKQIQERKERIEMAKINLHRDFLDYKNQEAERQHTLVLLESKGNAEQKKLEAEAEMAIELSHQHVLADANSTLKKLKTTSGMDNFRASVRPVLAYWSAILFSLMLGWVFFQYRNTINDEMGKQIVIGLFSTLTFNVTSITTFYYVARRNLAPRI